MSQFFLRMTFCLLGGPDRKNGINLIPSRYHWDQLDAKLIVLDINFPVRVLEVSLLLLRSSQRDGVFKFTKKPNLTNV
jgi:hypothetical protein